MPIKTIALTSLEEFISNLRPNSLLWDNNIKDWIFRGQRDANWHLIPKAFRPDTAMSFKYHNIRGISQNKRHQFEDELNLLLDFVEMADSLGLRIPGDGYLIRTPKGKQDIELSFKDDSWPPQTLLELLSIVQHHGVPTRLLDFSRNSLKAAFFAAEAGYYHYNNNPINNDDICVWALNRKMLTRNISFDFQRISCITVPRADNEYLHAQEGLFIYDCWANRDYDKPTFSPNLDDIILSLQDTLSTRRFIKQDIIYKITLPIQFSKLLLRELDKENINKAFLMPTFDNVFSTLCFNREIDHSILIRPAKTSLRKS